MEVLRDLRPLGRLTLVAATLALAATDAHAQRRGRAEPLPPPGPQQQWPVKTREHVDLWLHAFALLMDDTAQVPFFERGYAERMTVLKNARGVYTAFDAARDDLARTGNARNLLLNPQFLPLYFGSYDEMRQAFEYFFRAEGEPRRASNREIAGIIAFLGSYFPRPDERAWAKRFIEALDDERAKFYREYWLGEQRARARSLAVIDSLWQREWRPALQRFLNYSQQPNGDLLLSLVLGGEGRLLPAGKNANQLAVIFPRYPEAAEEVLFVFLHESTGTIARVAVADHVTPAQRRDGVAQRYESAGLVRGGALLAEEVREGLGEKYASFYLRQMGVTEYEGNALAALAARFPMPDEMVESMRRQIRLSFTGI